MNTNIDQGEIKGYRIQKLYKRNMVVQIQNFLSKDLTTLFRERVIVRVHTAFRALTAHLSLSLACTGSFGMRNGFAGTRLDQAS